MWSIHQTHVMDTDWVRVTTSQPVPVSAQTRGLNPHGFINPWHSLTPGPLSGLEQIYQSDGGGTPSDRSEVMDVPTNLCRRAQLSIGSAGGTPPAGAYPPPQPHAGATLRMHQFPGAHATILQYRRPSKPRARWKNPNQSDIWLFFFWFSWYILARPHMYVDTAVYKLLNKKKKKKKDG